MELRNYFIKDLPPRQRQYEAIRAVAFNEGTIEDIAARFRYTPQTLRMLINRLVRNKLQLFPDHDPHPFRFALDNYCGYALPSSGEGFKKVRELFSSKAFQTVYRYAWTTWLWRKHIHCENQKTSDYSHFVGNWEIEQKDHRPVAGL